MARHEYTCDFCGEVYRYPISTALCCDVVSNDLDDELDLDLDLDGSTIERSTN